MSCHLWHKFVGFQKDDIGLRLAKSRPLGGCSLAQRLRALVDWHFMVFGLRIMVDDIGLELHFLSRMERK